jgi:hypothetical protein
MNNLDTALRRILINGLFGSGILIILVLAVVFRYYIDKQTPQVKNKQHTEQISNTK